MTQNDAVNEPTSPNVDKQRNMMKEQTDNYY